ncbi:MAG: tetratricopeptide repeat protein [Anaerolineae bacterium]|nr:tetratricopeptide repeat protein [Anaerolineae bacterium]
MPTFLFTDIEGSTELWLRYPQAMEKALSRHDALLETLIAQHGGQVVKHTGDGCFAVFDGGAPLACAIHAQAALARQDWGDIAELRVRMALHVGVASQREADYFGLEVSRTARLLSAGWGGQILLTCELARSSALPPEATLRDLGNHLLKDLSEPQHIYQLCHPALPHCEFPALRTLSAHPHNLPPQPTPFVGRTRELQEIAERLAAPDCRLLTLVGPGGMGKTRLALQAAAVQIEQFPHGVYFVPLAALSSAESLVPAIAEALRFSFYQRDTPQTQLFNYVREKQLLLVLDNFEHIMEGATLVSALLARAPGVKVLVTSRERLNLLGEAILLLEGMEFPTGEAVADLEHYSAVQLFLQHARRVEPAFAFDGAQRACVARICAQVLGTPLALELAASWLRLLSCQEIAAELVQSLDVLSSAYRDTPERHRSLRAVFDYSWQLLDDPEKLAVQSLSVFQGPFHREVALAVLQASGRRVRPIALLQLLAALVDKSLLQRRTNDRYAMHPLLRQYALEKLQDAPALEAQVRQRHCAYYTIFLQQRQEQLECDQHLALAAIAEVFDDVSAAWYWAVQQQQIAYVQGAMHSLALFLDLSGRNQEGRPLFEAALAGLASLETPEADAARGWLLAYAAGLFSTAEDNIQVQMLSEAALTLNRRLEQPRASALALSHLGRVAWVQGDYPTATRHYQEALSLYAAVGDQGGQAKILDNLGNTAWSLGAYAEARVYYEKSLALFRQLNHPRGIASAFDHLGVVARDTGDLETAQAYFEQSYASFEALDARLLLAYAANHLGGVLGIAGNFRDAETYFAQCIAIGKEFGERRIVAYTHYDWGFILHENGDFASGRAMLLESLASFEMLEEPFGQILGLTGLGDLELENGNQSASRRYFTRAVRMAVAVQNPRLVSQALTGWGRYLIARACWRSAVVILGIVQALAGDHSNEGDTATALLAEVRSQLPDETFAWALAHGQAVDLLRVLREKTQEEQRA